MNAADLGRWLMIKKAHITVLWLLAILLPLQSYADYYQSDGERIYYTDSKVGEPVIVLLHGFTMDSSMWHHSGIVSELSTVGRVIALDSRGHGKSSKPESVDDYGPQLGKDVINLLEHLEVKKAHLVGYSMGAYIVARLLVSNPEKIQTAVLASGFFPTNDKQELLFQEATAKDMEAHGELALAAVARGWKNDTVSDRQIAKVTVPFQAIFGSEEINPFLTRQKSRLLLSPGAMPVVVIQGADHDSTKAAVLHPQLLSTVKNMVSGGNK